MADPKDWKTIGAIRAYTRETNRRDAALAKDRDAYLRLRREGHQPPHVGGSHALERDATLDLEVAMGKVFSKEDKPLAREGQERSEEIGLGKPEAISGF